MKRIIHFLRENTIDELQIPISTSASGRSFFRLKENNQNAAVKCFDLLVPTEEQDCFFIFKLQDNLEFKKIFPNYNYSCDFLLFYALTHTVMLIELKDDKVSYAKKQIKYTIPFLKYIFKLFELENNIKLNYDIKRLIVSHNRRRIPNTNVNNGYRKSYDNEYTILQVPLEKCLYEWNNLVQS